MATLLSITFATLMFALLLWGSIKLFDPYNPRNHPALALLFGLGFAVILPVVGAFVMFLPLLVLMFTLVRVYEIGIGRSVLIVVAMALLAHFTVAIVDAVVGGESADSPRSIAIVLAMAAVAALLWRRTLFGGAAQPASTPQPEPKRRRERASRPARAPARGVAPTPASPPRAPTPAPHAPPAQRDAERTATSDAPGEPAQLQDKPRFLK